jgi:putative transposase
VIDRLVRAKLSVTRACQIAGLSRAAYYKRPMAAPERDAKVIDELNALVANHRRW